MKEFNKKVILNKSDFLKDRDNEVIKLQMEFDKIVSQKITRDGIEKVMAYLRGTDFYTCPGSTRFHMNFSGGLLEHSLNVYKRLRKETILEYGGVDKAPYSEESIAIVSLFHDLCKANFYEVSTRNVKDKVTGKWSEEPYYSVFDQLPLGHGEKSVMILQHEGLALSYEEMLAIRAHMAGWDKDPAVAGSIMDICPLAVLLATADIKASKLDEATLE